MSESKIVRSSSNTVCSLKMMHDHILPYGWICKYEEKTGKYYFIQESETEKFDENKEFKRLEKTNIKWKFIFTAEESKAVESICEKFPNVEKVYISRLMKLYNNRTNQVISALLAEGHHWHSSMFDEALFYKLRASFSHVEPQIVRSLLIQNKNNEHETIEALLKLFGLFNTTRYEHSKRPQLKLKYLKFVYPEIDEIILLDLLFSNNLEVNQVIKHLKSIGHQTSEAKIKLSKISEATLFREAAKKLKTERPKSLFFQTKPHPNLWEQEEIRKKIINSFPKTSIVLINLALEASSFDIEITKKFLKSMTPQDSEKYLIHCFLEKTRPKKIVFVSREVQTKYSCQDLFGKFIIILDSQNYEKKMTQDNSTWTKEDGIIKKIQIKLSIGPKKENRKGPVFENRIIKKCSRIGPIVLKQGPNPNNRSKKEKKNSNFKSTQQGPNPDNRKGSMGQHVIRIKDQSHDDDDDLFF